METLADRLRNRRTELKMSQEDLAKSSGLSQSTIAHIESGRNKGTKHALPLADALGVDVRWLTDGSAKVIRGRTTDSAQNLPLFAESVPVVSFHSGTSPASPETGNVSGAAQYSLDKNDFRPVYVVEWPQGGMPERLWTDGEHPVGVTDRFAVLATTDPRAFLAPIIGTAMVPRFNPGEFALVEPGIEPELEDDVFVRLNSGETLLRRLVSRRGGVQLAAYNEPGTSLYAETDITWMFYVAHTVPARKIKAGGRP